MKLSRGGNNGDNRSINEWWGPKDACLGPQKNLLTALGPVGVEGVSQPTLQRRGRPQ